MVKDTSVVDSQTEIAVMTEDEVTGEHSVEQLHSVVIRG